jgi:hypothetical protein
MFSVYAVKYLTNLQNFCLKENKSAPNNRELIQLTVGNVSGERIMGFSGLII